MRQKTSLIEKRKKSSIGTERGKPGQEILAKMPTKNTFSEAK